MFSDELRKLRKQKKLNQTSLAEAVGMSQATVAAWENGTRKPDVETISFLADYFGVTVDYLMGREESPKEAPTPRDERRAQMEEILLRMPQDKYDQALAILEVLAAEQKKEG